MLDVLRPGEQVLGVLREISSAIRWIPCKCANRIKRSPPTQGDYFSARLVNVAHGDHCAEIAGSSAIFCDSGVADVLDIGRAGRAADFGAPFSKNAHELLPVNLVY